MQKKKGPDPANAADLIIVEHLGDSAADYYGADFNPISRAVKADNMKKRAGVPGQKAVLHHASRLYRKLVLNGKAAGEKSVSDKSIKEKIAHALRIMKGKTEVQELQELIKKKSLSKTGRESFSQIEKKTIDKAYRVLGLEGVTLPAFAKAVLELAKVRK